MRGSVLRPTRLLFAVLLLAAGWVAVADGPQVNGFNLVLPTGNLGTLEASAPQGCVIGYSATVFADAGGGEDSFQLQVVDDGQIVQVETLSVPADGAVHTVAGSFKLRRAPNAATPGIGLYLADGGVLLDAVDPLELACREFEPEVPTLAGAGYVALGSVLALAAILFLRRPRTAS